MPHFTESLDALRREAPARFLKRTSSPRCSRPTISSSRSRRASRSPLPSSARVRLHAHLPAHGRLPRGKRPLRAGQARRPRGESAPETVAFASALIDIYADSVAKLTRETEYDTVGNSPATYFICGVWANMKRGREFHPPQRHHRHLLPARRLRQPVHLLQK